MTRTAVQITGALLATGLCVLGFYSRQQIGDTLSDQMVAGAKIVALAGFVVLLGTIFWHRRRANDAGGPA